MPTTRVSPKHQITIPKPVFDEVQLEVGDILEARVHNGKIVLTPKRQTPKAPAVELTPAEQKILARAQAKIAQINNDILHSKGLTLKETEVAAKAGLIDEDQRYFWTEEWQKGDRAAERDIRAGRLYGPYETADELIADLHRLAREA